MMYTVAVRSMLHFFILQILYTLLMLSPRLCGKIVPDE